MSPLPDQEAQCTATAKGTGERCKRRPHPGMTVCVKHGAGSPRSRAAAARRLEDAKAAAAAARFGARRDIHPADALLELVHFTAGEVDYWRAQVALVEAGAADDMDPAMGGNALTWGVTGEVQKNATEFPGTDTTSEAVPHVAYRMMTDAMDRLARYSSSALKAGIDERRVKLAESQGVMLAVVIRRVLERLDLSEPQWSAVSVVVPEELRALEGGEGRG